MTTMLLIGMLMAGGLMQKNQPMPQPVQVSFPSGKISVLTARQEEGWLTVNRTWLIPRESDEPLRLRLTRHLAAGGDPGRAPGSFPGAVRCRWLFVRRGGAAGVPCERYHRKLSGAEGVGTGAAGGSLRIELLGPGEPCPLLGASGNPGRMRETGRSFYDGIQTLRRASGPAGCGCVPAGTERLRHRGAARAPPRRRSRPKRSTPAFWRAMECSWTRSRRPCGGSRTSRAASCAMSTPCWI